MAARVIRKRDVPEMYGRGTRPPGKPTATLRGVGQILFSRTASDVLGPEAARLLILFDEESRMLTVTAVEGPPKGLEEEDLFQAHRVKGRNGQGAIYLSGGLLMGWLGYDFRGSGNQIVDALLNEEKHSVSFVLPEGTLPLREARKRKSKPVATSYHHVRRKEIRRAAAADSRTNA